MKLIIFPIFLLFVFSTFAKPPNSKKFGSKRKYVCFIKKGKNRVKAIKVGSKRHSRYLKSNKYILGSTEYDSKRDAKADKNKECVSSTKHKYVYTVKISNQRVKAVKVGSRKHTKILSSDKYIVGTVEYDSKAEAEKDTCDSIFKSKLSSSKEKAIKIGDYQSDKELETEVKDYMRSFNIKKYDIDSVIFDYDKKDKNRFSKTLYYKVKVGKLACYAKAIQHLKYSGKPGGFRVSPPKRFFPKLKKKNPFSIIP